MWMPIFLFFYMVFEHSVVNMFLFPAGLMLHAKFSIMDYFIWNEIPTAAGNLVGVGASGGGVNDLNGTGNNVTATALIITAALGIGSSDDSEEGADELEALRELHGRYMAAAGSRRHAQDPGPRGGAGQSVTLTKGVCHCWESVRRSLASGSPRFPAMLRRR